MESFVLSLGLTLIAGLSTTIGSFIAILVKKPSSKFISLIMGFSAGVMTNPTHSAKYKIKPS